MTSDAILGGVIGSLLTVVVTKILDIVQKGREHRYSLQKSFFEKKLQAAEAAVGTWYTTASYAGSLAKLYERMSSDQRELDQKVFVEMNDRISTELQKLSQATTGLSNAVFLYFDFEDSNLWDYEPFGKFLDSLSSAVALGTTRSFMLAIHDSIQDAENKKKVWGEIEKIDKQIKECLKELSSILDKAQKEMVNLLTRIRTEMKKYEA